MLFEQTSLTREDILTLKEPFTVLGEEYWDILSIDGVKWTFNHVEMCYEELYPNGNEEITVEEIQALLECTTPEEREALGITVVDNTLTPPADPFDDLPTNPS